jgi:hypothetical protein
MLNTNIHIIGVKLLFSLTLVLLSTLSFSQISNRDNNDSDVLTASGEGDRVIKKSDKVSFAPRLIEDTSKRQLDMDYVFYEYTAPSEFTTELIKPAKLSVIDPLDKLQKGYIKAGVGTYTTPLVDFYYNSERSRNNNWGINAKHFSSNTGIKDIGFTGFSDNHARAFYKYFLNDFSIKGEVNYDRNVNYFYGFKESDTVIDKVLIKQRFNTIGGKVSLASYFKDTAELNYKGDVSFRNYTDGLKARENNFVFNAGAQKQMDSEIYGANLLVDVNSYNRNSAQLLNDTNPLAFLPNELKTTNTIIGLNPHIITNKNKFQAKVGLNLFIDIGDVSKFHFYPSAEFKYSFLDIFVPYIGVDGKIKRNSFYTLSQENPFVLSDLQMQNTNVKYNIYGGVRGSISNTVSFNLQASRTKLQGVPLYFNDTAYSIENKFDVVYDSIDVFGLSAQVSYHNGDKFNVYLKGEYNSYSTLYEQHAWNMPAVDITLGGVYDLADKILVRADVFFVGKRKAKSLSFVQDAQFEKNEYIVDLPAFLDFNLGFEYRYSKKISAFLNFNNIISKKYLMYNKYPVQGINIMGGVTFSF